MRERGNMEPELIRVKCSFCGKEIDCPEDMEDSEKHACFECFKGLSESLPEEEIDRIHVSIPDDKVDEVMPYLMVAHLMEDVFPEVWKEGKTELKGMPKREIAEAMFAAGADAAITSMAEMSKEAERVQKVVEKAPKGNG